MKIRLFFEGLKEGSKMFGEYISNIINFVLLSIVYIIGVGLTFIVAVIFKKKFLETSINKSEKSYWEELNLKKMPLEDYYRQF